MGVAPEPQSQPAKGHRGHLLVFLQYGMAVCPLQTTAGVAWRSRWARERESLDISKDADMNILSAIFRVRCKLRWSEPPWSHLSLGGAVWPNQTTFGNLNDIFAALTAAFDQLEFVGSFFSSELNLERCRAASRIKIHRFPHLHKDKESIKNRTS